MTDRNIDCTKAQLGELLRLGGLITEVWDMDFFTEVEMIQKPTPKCLAT